MSAGFTPGPWAVETPMGESAPWIVRDGLQAYEWEPIATLGDCTEDTLPPESKAQREIDANASLIAAAPDLYEALDRMVRAASDNQEPEVSAWLTDANAALAKARGEA